MVSVLDRTPTVYKIVRLAFIKYRDNSRVNYIILVRVTGDT